MVTISVPLDKVAMRHLAQLERNNPEMSRAGIVRKAIRKMTEEEAVESVLQARRETTLYGDLDTLLARTR